VKGTEKNVHFKTFHPELLVMHTLVCIHIFDWSQWRKTYCTIPWL